MYQIKTEVQCNDRALLYGDGLFTTMRVAEQRICLFDLHWNRILADTRQLYLPFPQEGLKQHLIEVAAELGEGVLKLLLSAGSGGRGYARPSEMSPCAYVSCHDMPAHYSSWRQKGIPLTVSSIKLAKQPLLAGAKHLNRLEQVMIKRQLADLSLADALVTDTDDVLIETSSSNIFWFQENNGWFTPSLANSGVKGVMREHILRRCRDQKLDVLKNSAQIADVISNCRAMFVCNSLMGIVPVTSIIHEDAELKLSIEPVFQFKQLVE